MRMVTGRKTKIFALNSIIVVDMIAWIIGITLVCVVVLIYGDYSITGDQTTTDPKREVVHVRAIP